MTTWLEKLRPLVRAATAFAQEDEALGNGGAADKERGVVRRGVSRAATRTLYRGSASFVDYLPWAEALDDGKLLLQDGRSVGALFEIGAYGTEGRPDAALADFREGLAEVLQDVFEERDESPWVLQTYTWRDLELDDFLAALAAYAEPRVRDTAYTREYLAMYGRHCRSLCRPEGYFRDETVTKSPWSGGVVRTYAALYRKLNARSDYKIDSRTELDEMSEKLFGALKPLGIECRPVSGRQFHRWMTRWFNGEPDADGEALKALVETDAPVPYGDAFAESLFYAYPRSDKENMAWHFDGLVSRVISVDGLRKAPDIGHATGERRRGDATCTMLDQLPVGAVMASTLVPAPQDTVERQVDAISDAAIGDASGASRAKADCLSAKEIMGGRQKLYRANHAFYLRASSVDELNRATRETRSVLLRYGLRAIAVEDDIRGLDNFILNLPMVYDPDDDRAANWRHTQLTWVQHYANMSPFFGRGRGTGHPGIALWNRGGEPLEFDPLNPLDRQVNAHALLIGPSGSGKSATLLGMLAQMMAVHRPRLFIIEAGNSFGLVSEWFESLGLSVNRIALKPGGDTPLPVFVDALKIREVVETHAGPKTIVEEAKELETVADDEPEEDIERDILGELEVIATLMITGGEEVEAARLRRADRRIIRDAIVEAGKTAHRAGEIPLTRHVREAFYRLARESDRSDEGRQRIREMGDAIGLFCDGFAGEVFDRPAAAWPDVDVTLVDLGHFAREGYDAELAIATIAVVQGVNNLAEREQGSGRHLVAAIDEAHLVMRHVLLAPYFVKIAKMWRKLGAWLWLATQDLDDFPPAARRLLNTIEWWIALVMGKAEVEAVERFKELSAAQREMLLSTAKEAGKFTEGAVFGKGFDALFRAVPPSLILALAQTEKDEKARRQALMLAEGIDEYEAARRLARELDVARGAPA